MTDGGNFIAQAKSLLQELKSYATELEQSSHEIQAGHVGGTDSRVPHPRPQSRCRHGADEHGRPRQPVAGSPYAVQGLISGYGGMNSIGGIVGKLNSLGSLVTTSYQTDRVYTCNDNSFACEQQRRFGGSPTPG